MLMILARLVRSESFWAVVKVRSPHNGREPGYPRKRGQTAMEVTEWSDEWRFDQPPMGGHRGDGQARDGVYTLACCNTTNQQATSPSANMQHKNRPPAA